MITCQICNQQFKKYSSTFSLHLKLKHTLLPEQYYLKFIATDNQCPYCNNKRKFKSITKGYAPTCGNRSCADKEQEKTCLKKYGTKHHLASQQIKDKREKTVKEKYGVDNVRKSKEIKQKIKDTKEERYGDPNYVNKEKEKQTKLERYGDENYNNHEKYKETCLQNFDCEHPFQAEKVKEKCIQSRIENFGVEWPMQSKELRNKRQENNFIKYGKEHTFQVQEFRDKGAQTCIEKYGVPHQMQNSQIFTKQQTSAYRYKDYTLPSGKVIKLQGYEPQALDQLLKIYNEQDIITDANLMPTIFYYSEDTHQHRYYPDIYIPKDNLIIEVKSVYTLGADLDKNLLKEKASRDAGFRFQFLII